MGLCHGVDGGDEVPGREGTDFAPNHTGLGSKVEAKTQVSQGPFHARSCVGAAPGSYSGVPGQGASSPAEHSVATAASAGGPRPPAPRSGTAAWRLLRSAALLGSVVLFQRCHFFKRGKGRPGRVNTLKDPGRPGCKAHALRLCTTQAPCTSTRAAVRAPCPEAGPPAPRANEPTPPAPHTAPLAHPLPKGHSPGSAHIHSRAPRCFTDEVV